MKRLSLLASVMFPLALALAAMPVLAQEKNPERNAYFGQTHQHTSWSPDAYIFGNTVTGPEEAYQYSIGQPIKHPAGYMVQIKTPLDFEGVTDHSEYVGVMRLFLGHLRPLRFRYVEKVEPHVFLLEICECPFQSGKHTPRVSFFER
jgi:Protein of unknown function (DUF3604)